VSKPAIILKSADSDHSIVGLAAPQAGNAPSGLLLGGSKSIELNFDPNDGFFKRQVSDCESFGAVGEMLCA
jgi:hypothetical protein